MYDVVGVGNPLLDSIFSVEESLLEAFHFEKQGMHLVDDVRRNTLLDLLGRPEEEAPGGSAANTLATFAHLGGKAVYVGSVGTDTVGDTYARTLTEEGVTTSLYRDKVHLSGNAITLVTPDRERTFATFLGASQHLPAHELATRVDTEAQLLFIEGYFLDSNVAWKGIETILARDGGMRIAFDFSDRFLIERQRDRVQRVIERADILFINDEELTALGEDALADLIKNAFVVAHKHGADGSTLHVNGAVHHIEAVKTEVTNTNGAGDAYAAGVLYGIVNGLSWDQTGTLASHLGATAVASETARITKKAVHTIKENLIT